MSPILIQILSVLIALIGSPVLAGIVTFKLNKSKTFPLLKFSKIPLTISFSIDRASVSSFNQCGYDTLYHSLYDYAFTSPDDMDEKQFTVIVSDLYTLFVALQLKDDAQLAETFNELFVAAYGVTIRDQLPIVINQMLVTLWLLVRKLQPQYLLMTESGK